MSMYKNAGASNYNAKGAIRDFESMRLVLDLNAMKNSPVDIDVINSDTGEIFKLDFGENGVAADWDGKYMNIYVRDSVDEKDNDYFEYLERYFKMGNHLLEKVATARGLSDTMVHNLYHTLYQMEDIVRNAEKRGEEE